MDKVPAFTSFINLAAEKLGGKTLECTDDFFAPMENLLKPGRGIFIIDKYTEFGKWMDGWESRRKRIEGHDWCIIELGAKGVIKGIDVDTNHFLGNHPPHCSIEACNSKDFSTTEAVWTEILPKSPLNPGSQHFFEIINDKTWSHIKLHIYPDGGVARLKVYGEVKKDWDMVTEDEIIDLAAASNGGKSIACNDMFFSHMDNLIMPGKGVNMGDGWETKRNRTPNNVDWVIVRLGHKGIINTINVDTHHFKGNFPDTCMIEACISDDASIASAEWHPLVERSKLKAHSEHNFKVDNDQPVTHVRLNIYPDGGISRMRVIGTKSM